MRCRLLLFLLLGIILVSVLESSEGKSSKKHKKAKSSESEEDEDDDPDESEIKDRIKCVGDINNCVATEMAYGTTAVEEKVRQLCTKQIKIFFVCKEYKESWKFTKLPTTRKPKPKKPKTTTATP